MNFFKKDHDIVRQNDKIMKTSHKHDVNLQKNSTLYFQIGLILVLLGVHALFEMNFESKPIEVAYVEPIEEDYMFNKRVKVIKEVAAKAAPKKKKPVIFKDPIVKKDDDPVEVAKEFVAALSTSTGPAVDPRDLLPVIELPEDDGPINIVAVEQVPIYPGCESAITNTERRVCMQKKLDKLINRKFNKELASDLGLSGRQKIYVQFKIDKSGQVTDVKARAPHSRLEREAQRVIQKVPKMTPGKQKDKNVGVIYQLPIIFQVDY
jgi:protein TonB